MVPGGITESIWHFSGYFHLFEDIARDRAEFDDGGYRSQVEDYAAKLLNYAAPQDDDPFVANPVQMLELPPFQDLKPVHVAPVKHYHAHETPPDDDHSQLPLTGFPPLPVSYGGSGGGEDFVIQVTYGPGGAQSLMDIHQVNYLVNDTTLELTATPSPELAALLSWETGNTLDRLESMSANAVPDWWNVPQDSADITNFVQIHGLDQTLIASLGVTEPFSVTPGYYSNGVLQTDPTLTTPDQLPVPQPAAMPELAPADGLGQWAYDGGNSTTNLAEIVDVTSSARTMIVLGNYYSTDAIFQTNAYANNDHVTLDDGNPFITTGGNQATNLADFVEHPGVYATLPAYFAGPQWNVEIVNGDYYNVHTLIQTNYLSNNNITVQESADTQYVVQGGGNQLENLAQINDGDFNYDLVIVGGNYSNFNAIFQNNILLNNDIIKMSGHGTDPSQTVSVGNNQLTNMATIDQYGGNNFQPFGADLNTLVNEVKAGLTQLDPTFGELVAGDGGTFNVLYVTGNYYDVNAIWQTNIVSNSNVIMQLLNPPSAGAEGWYGGSETQSVTTGNNVLANDAVILQANATTANVNGQIYTDTILIQANLVTQTSDHVTQANPQTLVPEIIAFIGTAEAPNTAPPTHPTAQPTSTAAAHDDPLASLTH